MSRLANLLKSRRVGRLFYSMFRVVRARQIYAQQSVSDSMAHCSGDVSLALTLGIQPKCSCRFPCNSLSLLCQWHGNIIGPFYVRLILSEGWAIDG